MTTARFAPSPTGLLHLGNARTALFNYLAARQAEGAFVLRVEDTDKERSRDEYVEALMADMRWLGMDWEAGPDQAEVEGEGNGMQGGTGPYRQSQRGEVYEEYFARLQDEGHAYPCFCTQDELEASRRAQRIAGQAPRYAGTCAHLSAGEVLKRLDQGGKPTLRFRVPRDQQVAFVDTVRGKQVYETNDIGDFIIRKADGAAAFFFCNALDDALMGIDLVLRGEDHLTNTPRQILILDALAMQAPQYGHISLITGEDGAPLSKRNGSRSLQDLRDDGFMPAAVVNHLARLGHTFEQDPGYGDIETIASAFRLQRLGKAPARHDEAQLLHWQKEALAAAADGVLLKWLRTALGDQAEGLDLALTNLIRDNLVMPGDALPWLAQFSGELAQPSEAADRVIAEAGSKFFARALQELDQGHSDFRSFSKAVGVVADVKGKALFMPLRAALSGETHGPEMGKQFAYLGLERVRARLQYARQRAEAVTP